MAKEVSDHAGLAAAPAAWRGEAWASLGLALPLVTSNLAGIAISTTDVVMMGWLGPQQLAAGALGHNLIFPLFLLGLGVLTAVAPMAAQALGAGRARDVRRTLRQGLWIAAAVGLPISLLLWQTEAILLLFGQSEVNASLAQGYMRALVWGLLPSFWFVALRNFVTAHERPRAVMVVTVLAVALNAFGNYCLMFGNFGFPRLELVGAGISSALVEAAMCLALLVFVLTDRRFRRYRLLGRFWRPDWPRFFEILRLGLPIGLTLLVESCLFAGATFLMGFLGTAQLAANAIAIQCIAVSFMIPLGLAQAATVRVGLAVGAGNLDRVGRAGWTALAIGMACMVLPAALYWFGGPLVIGLFLDSGLAQNREVVGFAVAFLAIGALFQFVDGAQVILLGALRGMKDTRVPLWISVFGYWGVGFTASVLLGFPLGLGGEGIWFGLALGLSTSAGLFAWRFSRRDRLIAPPRR
jgi:MATE family multidrug resistance protein